MKTNEEFISEVLTKAGSGKHRQFQLLRNWKEYANARQARRTLKLLTLSIKKSSRKFFKRYCTDITTGNTDIVKLLAYCAIADVLKYYEEELSIVNEMIYEYEAYLMEGNLLWTWLFNEQRPVDKLWDHRGL